MQHRAKKRFGQNFLVDPNTIARIVDSIQPDSSDLMIEIGPGLGAMTAPVLTRCGRLHVIELDRDVIPELKKKTTNIKGELIIHQSDVLKFDFHALHQREMSAETLGEAPDRACRIIGNLPYNISTPVLFHLLQYREIIQDMHFMLQKEVVDRIAAAPGNGTYGRLSVMIQAYFRVTPLFTVSPHAFRPVPRVDSAILRLEPDNRYCQDIADAKHFESLVRAAFSQRRKTLRNTVKPLCNAKQIEAAGVDPAQRAEELSVADFIRLHQACT